MASCISRLALYSPHSQDHLALTILLPPPPSVDITGVQLHAQSVQCQGTEPGSHICWTSSLGLSCIPSPALLLI